jgi:hypothetical protein
MELYNRLKLAVYFIATPKWLKGAHDCTYGFLFSFATTPVVYKISEMILGKHPDTGNGALWASLLSIPMGFVGGYAVDKFRKVWGINVDKKTGKIYYESEREEQKSKKKRELRNGLDRMAEFGIDLIADDSDLELSEDRTQTDYTNNSNRFGRTLDSVMELSPETATAVLEDQAEVPMRQKPQPLSVANKSYELSPNSYMGERTKATALALTSTALTFAYYWMMR